MNTTLDEERAVGSPLATDAPAHAASDHLDARLGPSGRCCSD